MCLQRGAQLVLVYFPFRGQKDKNVIQEVFDDLAATQSFRTLDFNESYENRRRGEVRLFQKGHSSQ